MLHTVSTSEGHLPEEKSFPGNEEGKEHSRTRLKGGQKSVPVPQGEPSFLFVAVSGDPSLKGCLSSFPQASKPGQVWHEWDGCFQDHTYLTETCV